MTRFQIVIDVSTNGYRRSHTHVEGMGTPQIPLNDYYRHFGNVSQNVTEMTMAFSENYLSRRSSQIVIAIISISLLCYSCELLRGQIIRL